MSAEAVEDGDPRCIFCEGDAKIDPSVEHIVPESLGNAHAVLQRGVVCRKCNSYFAVKVERPLLDSEYFRALRFRQWIPSKRGRIPVVEGVEQVTATKLLAYRTADGDQGLVLPPDANVDEVISRWRRAGQARVEFSAPAMKADRHLEQLVAKIGIETLAAKCCHLPRWKQPTVFHRDLIRVRRFARFGEGSCWPIHVRRIYGADALFPSLNGMPEQIMNETDILYTDRSELYGVFALFGVELVINLGGPELDGYRDWLSRHDNASPLYFRGGRVKQK